MRVAAWNLGGNGHGLRLELLMARQLGTSHLMEAREPKFRLIENRFTAILAVCTTGYLAWRDIRAVFSNIPQKSGWIMSFDFLPLPDWIVAAINLLFYAYLLWIAIWFYRRVEGSERIVVAGFFMSGFIGFLARIDAFGSQQLIAAIRSLQSGSMTVAFVAAVVILLKSPAFDKGDAKTALRLFAFVGAFLVAALLIGGVIYFFQ